MQRVTIAARCPSARSRSIRSRSTPLPLLGIVIQLASAVLIGALFHTLRHARARAPRPRVERRLDRALRRDRRAARPLRRCRELGGARLCEDAPRQKDWATAAFYVVYQLGKFAFFGLFLSGTVAFVRAGRRRGAVDGRRAFAAAVATVAIASASTTSSPGRRPSPSRRWRPPARSCCARRAPAGVSARARWPDPLRPRAALGRLLRLRRRAHATARSPVSSSSCAGTTPSSTS